MTKKTNTGGFVYPSVDQVNGVQSRGITLRDHFASKAMEGFNKGMVDYGWDEDVLFGHAKQAYAIADAMIKARDL